MAIDSQQKRMAAATAGRPWARAQFPVVAKDSEWRMTVGLSYPYDIVAVVTPIDVIKIGTIFGSTADVSPAFGSGANVSPVFGSGADITTIYGDLGGT